MVEPHFPVVKTEYNFTNTQLWGVRCCRGALGDGLREFT